MKALSAYCKNSFQNICGASGLSEGTSSLVLLISGSFFVWEDLFDKGSEHGKTKVLPFLSCLWAVHWSPVPCWMGNKEGHGEGLWCSSTS